MQNHYLSSVIHIVLMNHYAEKDNVEISYVHCEYSYLTGNNRGAKLGKLQSTTTSTTKSATQPEICCGPNERPPPLF